MTNVIDCSDLFTSRKRHHEERAALTYCENIKNRLNSVYGLRASDSAVYTVEDMEREQDRQRRLVYSLCLKDLSDWVERLITLFPSGIHGDFVKLIADDITDRLLLDWNVRAR